MTRFIFDLDGTVTKQKILPLLAKRFPIRDEIQSIMRESSEGNTPFVESFIKRVYLLSKLPVDEVRNFMSKIDLYKRVVEFMRSHQQNCLIATTNLKNWVADIEKRVGCPIFCSSASECNNSILKLTSILKKENVVLRYQSEGEKVVYVGNGNDDVEAMRLADVSIASGLACPPVSSVLSISDYVVYNEKALCRLLNQLIEY